MSIDMSMTRPLQAPFMLNACHYPMGPQNLARKKTAIGTVRALERVQADGGFYMAEAM